MNGLKKETMAKVFDDFSVLFDKTISDKKLDILWDTFKTWDEARFLRTATELRESCRFMPTIADFYSKSSETVKDL